MHRYGALPHARMVACKMRNIADGHFRQCVGTTRAGRRCKQAVTGASSTCGQCRAPHPAPGADVSASDTLSPDVATISDLGEKHQLQQYQEQLDRCVAKRDVGQLESLGRELSGDPWSDSEQWDRRQEADAMDLTGVHKWVREAVTSPTDRSVPSDIDPDVIYSLLHWPHNPERDNELSDWLMSSPNADLALEAAAWVTAGHALREEVWDWHNNPHAVALAEHPDHEVRWRFVCMHLEPPPPGWNDWELFSEQPDPHIHWQQWSGPHATSAWHGEHAPGGLGEIYRRRHRDIYPPIRCWLWEWRRTDTTPNMSPPLGTPVSQPNGTWTDIDMQLMTDPAIRNHYLGCTIWATRGEGMDYLPDDVVEDGLHGSYPWGAYDCNKLVKQGWIDLNKHGDAILKHNSAEVRATYIEHNSAKVRAAPHQHDGAPPSAAFKHNLKAADDIAKIGCNDTEARVRWAAACHLTSRPASGEVPIELVALQVDPDKRIASRVSTWCRKHNLPELNDATLRPHIGTDAWRSNRMVRRAAAVVSKDPTLLAELASDRIAAVVEPLLDRDDLPAEAWMALTRHHKKRIRTAAQQQLDAH